MEGKYDLGKTEGEADRMPLALPGQRAIALWRDDGPGLSVVGTRCWRAGKRGMGMNRIQTFSRNTRGRDFAVGDIHGYFTRLRAALDLIGFNPEVDRLFSVGDLVDRGPECEEVLHWLRQPWFHAVMGNHDDMAIRWVRHGKMVGDNWRTHGGGWFLDLPQSRQREIAEVLAELPNAIEVDTTGGIVGIVHADCPSDSWTDLRENMREAGRPSILRSYADRCMWSRERFDTKDRRGVQDIRAVVVGHTPADAAVILGNVYHIDTGGWLPEGHFTLLELARLQPIAARAGLDLSDMGAVPAEHS
jgi:serine/threonine protein phosphatase 1